MSISFPVVWRILSIASFMIERVFKPKKSIFINPVSSITEPSYWVTSIFSPVSLSSAVLTGTQSVISSRPMITPHACTPVPRTLPSSIWAYFMVSRINMSGDSHACCNSGTAAIQFFKLILGELPLTSGSLSGMSFVSLSDSDRDTFCTRATSLMDIFVAIVP